MVCRQRCRTECKQRCCDRSGAASSNEEATGWMQSTKVANLTVESNKKTEKGQNKVRAAVLQPKTLPATGKEEDG